MFVIRHFVRLDEENTTTLLVFGAKKHKFRPRMTSVGQKLKIAKLHFLTEGVLISIFSSLRSQKIKISLAAAHKVAFST